MIIYSVVLFLAGGLFSLVGLSIYRGNTDLIHSYHQKQVTDKAAYGKSFGKAMFVFSLSFFLSGSVALMGSSDALSLTAVGILVLGLALGLVCILRVQRKFNKGLF